MDYDVDWDNTGAVPVPVPIPTDILRPNAASEVSARLNRLRTGYQVLIQLWDILRIIKHRIIDPSHKSPYNKS